MTDTPKTRSRTNIRLAIYWILIISSIGSVTGRIMSVRSSTGETPMLSANDRSRWCTIRSLVDEQTYVIDKVIDDRHHRTGRRHWYTIDQVRHLGEDGREHAYSSKPTLLPTMLAGQYWVIQRLAHVKLETQPFYIIRLMLVITNVVPLLVYFGLLARLVEAHGTTVWGRVFVMCAATWGTFLTTFAITLNNHLPAAISALVTLYVVLPVWRDEKRSWWRFAVAGLFAAFTAANELPALSFLVAVGCLLVVKSPLRTILGFVPAAAVVVAAFFGTNYLAHQSWRPAYAHRQDGPVVATIETDDASPLAAGTVSETLHQQLLAAGIEVADDAQLLARDGQRWVLRDPQSTVRYALIETDQRLEIRDWDHWYDYEDSYWMTDKVGIDAGEPDRRAYLLNMLVGHHGVFSLSPIWLLSALGLLLWLFRSEPKLRVYALMVLVLSVVCLAFYATRPLADRNYGGVSCGFRWMFWFIPMWLLCLLPAADLLSSSRWLRWLGLLLLLISAASVTYSAGNPWSHPWIFDYWQYIGFIKS